MYFVRTRERNKKIFLRLSDKAERPIIESFSGADRVDEEQLYTKASRVVPTGFHCRRIEESHAPHTL